MRYAEFYKEENGANIYEYQGIPNDTGKNNSSIIIPQVHKL
jgi:hypothetical protein